MTVKARKLQRKIQVKIFIKNCTK